MYELEVNFDDENKIHHDELLREITELLNKSPMGVFYKNAWYVSGDKIRVRGFIDRKTLDATVLNVSLVSLNPRIIIFVYHSNLDAFETIDDIRSIYKLIIANGEILEEQRGGYINWL